MRLDSRIQDLWRVGCGRGMMGQVLGLGMIEGAVVVSRRSVDRLFLSRGVAMINQRCPSGYETRILEVVVREGN